MTRAGKVVAVLVLALLAVATAAGLALGWAWQKLHRPFPAATDVPLEVRIPAGAGGAAILRQLEDEGILENADLARLYLVHVLDDPPLKAGNYRFETPLTVPEVIAKLERGEVQTRSVTVVEGLVYAEIASALAGAGFGDREAFLAEMERPDRIIDLDPEATNLEGYLFPDTYAFAEGIEESVIVDLMVATFRRRLEEIVDPATIDVRDLVTLASIVEKEAQLDEERPIIAGVYANRLRRGIGLYADPTVIYALRLAGTWDGNLRRSDLAIDSPYNTYRYPGLPPGPIASPGRASLEAAATPADVEYLYFVSRNDGSHAFARTLAEHNRNVEIWQRQYWRQKWAAERAAAAEVD